MRRIIYLCSFLLACLPALRAQEAEQPVTTVTCDTVVLGDSVIIIETACAPICSSIAHVHINNKDWFYIGTIPPPDSTWVFPEAYIDEHNTLQWRNNTPEP